MSLESKLPKINTRTPMPKVLPPKGNESIWQKTADNWPSEIVARQEVSRFTGGLFTPKTMANLDSLGEGPKRKVRYKRKVGYPKKELVTWLCSQSAVIETSERRL